MSKYSPQIYMDLIQTLLNKQYLISNFISTEWEFFVINFYQVKHT